MGLTLSKLEGESGAKQAAPRDDAQLSLL